MILCYISSWSSLETESCLWFSCIPANLCLQKSLSLCGWYFSNTHPRVLYLSLRNGPKVLFPGPRKPSLSLDPAHCPHTPFYHPPKPMEHQDQYSKSFSKLFKAYLSPPKLSHHHLGLIASFANTTYFLAPAISITVFSTSSTNCRLLLHIWVWGKRFTRAIWVEFALQINVY